MMLSNDGACSNALINVYRERHDGLLFLNIFVIHLLKKVWTMVSSEVVQHRIIRVYSLRRKMMPTNVPQMATRTIDTK